MKNGASLAGYLYAFLAGSIWGTSGLFIRALLSTGMDSVSILLWRTLIPCHLMLLAFLVFRRDLFAIERRDVVVVALAGISSVVLTGCAFFYTVTHTSLAIATMLNHTAPLFVTVISRLCFGEPITARKSIALVIASFSLVLILGLYDARAIGRGSAASFAAGLASGLFYAVQSILSKKLVHKYHPLTVNSWMMFLGGWALFLLGRLTLPTIAPIPAGSRLTMALFCFGPGFIAFYCLLRSLSLIQASHASIMAMAEPVVAPILGYLVLHESLTPVQISGMLTLLGAIVLVTTDRKPASSPATGEPAAPAQETAPPLP